jgi:hypothetical protein
MENKKRKGSDITQENDKSFVKDGLSTDDIRKTIQQIRAYIEKGGNTSLSDKIDKLKQDYSFFLERYPMLFDMCTRTDFNYQHLNYFLSKRDEIISDKISSEDASIQVGQEWFDKYVDVSKLKNKDEV